MSESSFHAAAAAVASAPAGLPGAVQGVDVAAFQHPVSAQFPDGAPISWPQVAGAGIAFAAVKATEGNYYVNPFYARDLAGASAAGLAVIGYAFANPKPADGTAADQAQYLVAHAGTVSGRTPPLMLDIEYNPYSGGECYGLTPDAMVTWISQFNAEVQALTGQLPILYTTQDWWALCTGGSTAFSADPMWDAAFTTAASPPQPLPAGWGDWALWQYASAGTVPGIATSGATDLDALNLVSPGDQQAAVGQPVSVAATQFTAGPGPNLSYSAPGLPAGLAVDATGLISGTPSASDAAAPVTITASAEGAVLGSVSLTWDIQGPVSLTPPAGRTTGAGSPVDFTVPAVSAPAGQAISVTAAGLPPGVSVSSAGRFLGWPARAGVFRVTVSAADSAGDSGTGAMTWSVTAAPDAGPAGPVRLGNGRCLEDTGNSSAAGTRVRTAACNGSTAQSWTVVRDLTLRIHGKCLAALGTASVNGTKVGLATCSGAAGQRWSGRTSAELVNAYGKCLADPFTGAGAVAWIQPCNGQATQQWTLPAGPVTSQIPGGCLNDPNQSTLNGTVVQLWPCNGRPAQAWTATAGSALQILGKCLQARRTASGAWQAVLAACNSAVTAQRWAIAASGAGIWYRNAAAGQCLASPGTAPASHPAITLGPCTAASPAITWQHV